MTIPATNNRERKREQDEKLDHRCGGYSPPTDATVVLMRAIEQWIALSRNAARMCKVSLSWLKSPES